MVNKPRASEKDFSKERSAAWEGKAGRGSSGKEMLLFPLPLLKNRGVNLHASCSQSTKIRAFLYP